MHIEKRLWIGLAAGVMAIGGCSSTPGADTHPTASPSGSAAPLDAPLASASASSDPSAPPRANVSAFGYLLTTGGRIDLFQVDDAAFAISQAAYQPVTYKIDDASVSEVDVFKTLKVRVSEGDSTRYFRILAMSGSANGDLDVTYNQPGERGGSTFDAHLRKAAWKIDPEYPYLGDCWGGGCTVLDGNYLIVSEENVFSLGAPSFMAPQPRGWVPVASKQGAPAGCTTRLAKYVQIGTVADQVYAIGPLCTGKGESGDMAVETWKRGSATSTVAALPGKAEFGPFTTSVRAMNGGWLLTAGGDENHPRPYLARFDGKAWAELTPEGATGGVDVAELGSKRQLHVFTHDKAFRRDGEKWTALAFPARKSDDGYPAVTYVAAPDDAVWIVVDERLYRVPPGGAALEQVVLPSPPADETAAPEQKELSVYDVRFTPNGDAIVAAFFGNTNYLLAPTKRAPPKPMVAATPTGKTAFGDVKPASAGCTKPFVVLYGMTKVAPDDYDFPLTRKALKGQTKYKETRFWVTRDAGQRFLIARVATVDLGKELVKDISASVKDSTPQLLCGDPAETIRELKIDLVTGDVVK